MNAIRARAGSGAKLWIYSGIQPASPDDSGHGQQLLLGPFVLGSTLGPAATLALPSVLTVDCTGVAPVTGLASYAPSWWRITDSSGTDGSAGVVDGEIIPGDGDQWPDLVQAGLLHGLRSFTIESFEVPITPALMYLVESADVSVVIGDNPIVTGAAATNQRTGVVYQGSSSIQAALNAAISGDTILVAPNQSYTPAISITKAITIRSVVAGSKWQVNGTGLPGSTACIGIDAAAAVVVEDAEVYGNKLEWNYNAGVTTRVAGASVILRRCLIRDNSNGWLGAVSDTTGTVLFENCEFRDNGDYNGLSHNIYASGANLTMRGCWSRELFYVAPGGQDRWKVSWGHLVKSRARVTTLEGCRFTMESGEANRCVDLPNGGDFTMRGCLLEYNTRQNAGGGQFISFGVEEALNPAGLPVHRINCQQNTFVNHGAGGSAANLARFVFWIMTNASGVPAPSAYSVTDNVFAGDYLPANKDGFYGAEGNVYSISNTLNTVISSASMASQMPNHATYDFTLATPVAGAQNWAAYYYAHPTNYIARADSYRGGVPAGTVVNGVWTPVKDGTNTITDASWAELPLNTVVEWAGTALQTQLTPPYGAEGSFQDFGTEGIAGHFDDWVGAAFDDDTGRFWVQGGGHAGSSNNMLSCFDARTGLWSVAIPPTPVQKMPPTYATGGLGGYQFIVYPDGFGSDNFVISRGGDGRTCAMHTYGGLIYTGGEVVRLRGGIGQTDEPGGRYWHANLGSVSWVKGGPMARPSNGVEQHSALWNGVIYWGMEGGQAQDNLYWTICRYNVATKQELAPSGIPNSGLNVHFSVGGMLSAQLPNGQWLVADFNPQAAALIVINLTTMGRVSTVAVSGRLPADYGTAVPAVYVPERGAVVAYNVYARAGGAGSHEFLELNPNTGVFSTSVIVDPYNKRPALHSNGAVHTRMRYWSTKKVLILHSRTMQNAVVVRFG